MTDNMALLVKGVTRRFGGLVAVNDMTFDLAEGEVLGLIGPNGSGKTTMINLISGALKIDDGTIRLYEHDISGRPANDIARRGVARTFQIVRILASMSVLENVMAGGVFGSASRWGTELEDFARAQLARVGMPDAEHLPVDALTYIDQKRVELARALAGEPRVLLLDEWLAGLNPTELQTGIALIEKLRSDGCTIIIVEHVMDAIRSLCDRCVVMNSGLKIAEGTPADVLSDPEVIRAYLETRMLEIADLSVSYGKHQALDGVSASVKQGELVVMLGANGAGKSTFLRAVAGITPKASAATVSLGGRDISGLPAHEVVEAGIALVPEGRGVFGELSVQENLRLGANPRRARPHAAANMEKILDLFPVLADRRKQTVRTMSGGEQQMVAIGRAMMSAPDILLLDEPSLGLSPLLCSELFKSLAKVRDASVGILMVEQNAKLSLAISDRGYLLENGRIAGTDTAEALRNDQRVQAAYLGAG